MLDEVLKDLEFGGPLVAQPIVQTGHLLDLLFDYPVLAHALLAEPPGFFRFAGLKLLIEHLLLGFQVRPRPIRIGMTIGGMNQVLFTRALDRQTRLLW